MHCLNDHFGCGSLFTLLVLSLFILPNHGQTLTCTSSCPSGSLPACCGGDISAVNEVNCQSGGLGAVCSGTQTWTSSASSLTYRCTSNAQDSLACEGLHLIINAGSTATQITIFCDRERACKDAIFEIRGPQTNLVEVRCGTNAAGGCLNTTVISDGDITKVNCQASGGQSSPTCEGMTVRNTGTSDKKLIVDCAGYWTCGNSTLGKPITMSHVNGQPQLICRLPLQVGRAPCSGDFVFEQSASLGTVLCQRGTATIAQSVCEGMSVLGNKFNVTCEAQNDAMNGPVCQNLALATTSAGLQDLTITCRGTASAAKFACSGNIALTNTFANTAFFCDGIAQGANNICQNSRFIMTAAPSGSNTANCPDGPDCSFVTHACEAGSCPCKGNVQGCTSRTVVTRVPTKSPSNTPTASPVPPSQSPSASPTAVPSQSPTSVPSVVPSYSPSSSPTSTPSIAPSTSPSYTPSALPSAVPTMVPSRSPSTSPSSIPSGAPSSPPSQVPTTAPSSVPSSTPSVAPSVSPSAAPSISPTSAPSKSPTTSAPTSQPSQAPSSYPTTSMPTSYPISSQPSRNPTKNPTMNPVTSQPTKNPTKNPTANPTTTQPTNVPSAGPSKIPSKAPSLTPTRVPTVQPTMVPSGVPSHSPSDVPTNGPSGIPSLTPSSAPSDVPSASPTTFPTTNVPSTSMPSAPPSGNPTQNPTQNPATRAPSVSPLHIGPVGERATVGVRGPTSVTNNISRQSEQSDTKMKTEQGVASTIEDGIRTGQNVSVKIQANLTNTTNTTLSSRRRLLEGEILFTYDLFYANLTNRGVSASDVRNATQAERMTIEKKLRIVFARLYNTTNINLSVTFETLLGPIRIIITTTTTTTTAQPRLGPGARVGIILGVLGGITLIVVGTLWYFKQKEPTPTMQGAQMAVR